MDKIGLNDSELELCDQLLWTANAYWKNKDAVLASMGTQKSVDTTCSRLRGIFATVGESNNFHLLVAAERTMCLADLEHFQRSQQNSPNAFSHNITLRTLQEGVDQMKEISNQLKLRDKDIQTFHRYSSGTRTIKSEHDGRGLPKDGIRRLLSSHKTRLQNKATGIDGTSNEEQTLLWYRLRNIQTAERLYKAMQRESLGFDDRSEGRGQKR